MKHETADTEEALYGHFYLKSIPGDKRGKDREY